MNPIWKDCYVSLGAGDVLLFRVKRWTGSSWDILYGGKSVKRPGEASNRIRINDVVADYLKAEMPSTTIGEYVPGGEVGIAVDVYSSGSWQNVFEDTFLNDWSYDRDVTFSEGNCISFPINRRADERQLLPFSFFHAEDEVVINEETDDYSEDLSFEADGTGTITYIPQSEDRIISATSTAKYDIIKSCSKYALLYLNAFGGWDTFLIEGNTTEIDNLERHSREKEYDNRDAKNASRENYLNEIVRAFTFHTGWLSDDESQRMPHLLNSTRVYLQDLNANTFTPVILTNTSTEHKTYKSTGTMVDYEISVEVAHNYIRR